MKKWTYLVAALLTASAGSLLTGCIDNDEPYGIEQIRVATANLLEAKKAAVEASAAAEAAKVEIAKIEAEIKKAQLEVEKISAEAAAKVLAAEAEAKTLAAQAAAAKTEAEAKQLLAQAAIAQAQADAIKAETEAQAKLAAAQLNDFIAKSEIQIKQANLKYDEAVYAFEKLKKDNLDKANDVLYKAVETAYGAYIGQLAAYNDANKNYLMAQRAYAESEVDLEWNGNGFGSPDYEKKALLEKAVADAQAQIDNINNSTAEYEDAIAKLEGIQASELYTLLEDYKAKEKANEDAMSELNVKRAEIELQNKELFDSYKELDQAAIALKDKNIAIPEYKTTPALGIPGFATAKVIVKKGNYTLNNKNNYNNAVANVNNAIESLNDLKMDPNDQAWTQATINELTRKLDAEKKANQAQIDAWKDAVTVYNNGGVPELKDLPGKAAIDKAVSDYNTAGTDLAAKKAAVNAADKKLADEQKAYEDALKAHDNSFSEKGNATIKAYNDARKAANANWEAAQSKYDDTVNKAAATKQAEAIYAKRVEYQKCWNAEQIALREWQKNETTQADKLLKANYDAAAAKTEAAWKAVEAAEAEADKANIAADKAYDSAVYDAETELMKARQARNLALNEARHAFELAGAGEAEKSEAWKAVMAAEKVMNDAQTAQNEAWQAYNKAVNETRKKLNQISSKLNAQQAEIDFYMYNGKFFTLRNDYDAYTQDMKSDKLPVANATELNPFMEENNGVYGNAKEFVKSKSRALYGDLSNLDNDNDYNFAGVSSERLLELTKEEADKYLDKNFSGINPWDRWMFYYNFGSFGSILALEDQIAIATACLNNDNPINDAVKGLEDYLKALKDANKAATDESKAADKEAKKVKDQIDALYAAIDKQLTDLRWMDRNYNTIITEINSAVANINALPTNNPTQYIENAIERFKNFIESNNNSLESAKAVLEKAQYQLDQYNNGYKDLENPLKLDVDMAKAELDRQQNMLDFYKARLDEVQAVYEAATKKD